MAQAAAVAQCDCAAGVDAVVADPVVACWWVTVAAGLGLDARGVGHGGCLARERPVRALLVVVGDEAVDLRLQSLQRASGALRCEVLLECLVEALDLAASLRVVGVLVLVEDAERDQLGLYRAAPIAGRCGVDRPVV